MQVSTEEKKETQDDKDPTQQSSLPAQLLLPLLIKVPYDPEPLKMEL